MTGKYKWKAVNLDDFGTAGNTNFEGLLGIEECFDYSVLSKRKARRNAVKEKHAQKRPAPTAPETNTTPKKSKNNSFTEFKVESVKSKVSLTPSKSNEAGEVKKNNKKKDKKSRATSDNDPSENVDTEAINENDAKENIKKAKKEKIPKNPLKNETDKKLKQNKLEQLKNETNKKSNKQKKSNKTKGKQEKKQKYDKTKETDDDLAENEDESVVKMPESNRDAVPLEEMQAWMQFSIPEVILKALAEQGFRSPTAIQELTLPAALHGRRDILGAAETGSGKTLAFGIPILTGILRLKEDALNGIEEKSLDLLANRLTNPFVNEPAKIVNMNKLTKEEKKALMKEIKGKKKFKRRKPVSLGGENGEDSDDDGDDSDDDGPVSEEENSEDEMDIHEEDSEPSDMGSEDEELNIESGDESVDLGIGSGEDDSEEDNIPMEANDDDESDFEEREEEVEGVNEKGIGCVKVIDNISPDEIPELVVVPKRSLKPLYALILTPTRELAIQVKNHLVAAAKYTDILIAVVVGGMAEVKQERVLKRGPEIVVATPGRLWQMIQQGNRHLSQVTDIRYLAIDETDRMMERGHFEELHHLLDKINDDLQRKARRQTFVFSATLTMVHDLPHHLKGKKVTKKGKVINKKVEKLTAEQKLKKVIEMLGITDPKVVDVTEHNQGSSNTLTECRIMCPIDHKDFYLYYVLKRYPGRTIVFCNSIGCVKRLAQLFGLLACNPLPLHASMQQRQRLKNLDRFRDSPHGLLIATDVAARGLDIPNVEHVVHYQVPRTAENYVHRSGRTARASREGIAILIMEPTEVQNYTKMCKTLAKTEDLPHFPVDGGLLTAVRRRVDLARELDLLTLKVRKDSANRGWLEKAALDMDIVIDETDLPRRMENEEASDLKNVLVVKKKQLNSLLGSPLFPKGFSYKFPTNNMLEHTLNMPQKQNAVQAMKSAMESKKKPGKAGKIDLKSEPIMQAVQSTDSIVETILMNGVAATDNEEFVNNGEKVSKNKWKKMKRNKT